jgi:hypothetical protein
VLAMHRRQSGLDSTKPGVAEIRARWVRFAAAGICAIRLSQMQIANQSARSAGDSCRRCRVRWR